MGAFYSIKDLETLSGIKAHTIRIWEQRYGILQAERTATNIRVYNDRELKQLMSISLLNRKGYKISKLAHLSEQELHDKVLGLVEIPTEFEAQIEGMILATIDYDDEKFEKILNTSIIQIGFEETVRKIIFPFLERVGIMWVAGSLIAAQEHFVSQLIRQKIIVAIDGQVKRHTSKTKKWILFLPNGEWHEMSLLFLNYILNSKNQKVIYLGASVQLKEVITVAKAQKPDYFYTIITSIPQGYSVHEYLNTLATEFSHSTIFASGYQLAHPPAGIKKNIKILKGMEAVLAKIGEIAA